MVYLLPTEEQLEVTGQVGDFLSGEFPLARFREGAAPHDLSQWQSLIGYGLTGLGASEAAGGSGLPLTDETLIFREMGRALLSPAVLASAMANRIAATQGLEDIAAALIGGSQRACLALPCEPGHPAEGLYLLDYEEADLVLIASPGQLQLFPIAGWEIEQGDPLDESLSLGRSAGPAGEPLAVGDEPFVSQFVLLCAAQLTGMSEEARDLAVDYAKMREQFGRPIGSFQAIKHRCADMAIRTEIALAQLYRASVTARDQAADAGFHAAAAFQLANRAAQENAAAAIQIHGGIGFTAECDVHWLLKRAHVMAMLNISSLAEPAVFLRSGLGREGPEEIADA